MCILVQTLLESMQVRFPWEMCAMKKVTKTAPVFTYFKNSKNCHPLPLWFHIYLRNAYCVPDSVLGERMWGKRQDKTGDPTEAR